ncbi:zinc finger protein 316-like [Nyctibius grandis]|uniref:zinc finger protein 316-like n=1 Tax=Nyctibius grandis TaxID=48427 RepID=UPI0035BBB3DF
MAAGCGPLVRPGRGWCGAGGGSWGAGPVPGEGHRGRAGLAQAVLQEPVSFEDVAVRFSAEEWRGLAGWQKGLYKEVTMESYQLIASLGSAGPKPELVLELERGEEPHPGDPPAAPAVGTLRAPGTGGCPRRRLPGCRAGKRKDLCLADRVRLLAALESPSASLSSVAKLFGISRSQAGRIGQRREQILADWGTHANPLRKRRRRRRGEAGDVEDALVAWSRQALARGERLSEPVLKAKAQELALGAGRDLVATDGWLCQWKARHNVVFKGQRGEEVEVDAGSAQSWVSEVLPALLAGYRAQDVFSAGETGLLYRGYPVPAPGGGTSASARVSVLCCANHTGTEKRRLLVVGRSRRPRCLPEDPRALPVAYAGSADARVTAPIFREWLLRWDRELRRLRRSVLLFVARGGAHPPELRHELRNVRLVFFPAAGVAHPMDAGVIPNLKGHYRALVLARAAQGPVAEVAGRVTLLDAVYLLHRAWGLVRPATVQSCFRKAGFYLVPPGRRETEPGPLADVPRPPCLSEPDFVAFVGMDAAEPAVGEGGSPARRDAGAAGGEEEEEEEEEGEAEAGSPVTAAEALAGLSTAMKWCQLHGLVGHWERLLETESALRTAAVAEAARGTRPAPTGCAPGTVPTPALPYPPESGPCRAPRAAVEPRERSGCPVTPAAWGGTAGEGAPEDGNRARWVPCVSPAEEPRWEPGEQPPGVPVAGGEGLVICGTCGQSFEDRARLSAHQGEHRRPAPCHRCRACGKAFRHHRNLLTHKKHRGRRRHACAECGGTFCVRGDLLRHRASHGGEGGCSCPPRGHRCRHRRELPARREGHAGGEAGPGAVPCEERPFVCGRCGRSFSWRESLVIHQRAHAPELAHKCPDCGRGFSRRGNLRAHRRVHTGERPFACPHCDRAFCTQANLATHAKLHRRCRAFACSLCRRGFGSRGELLRHQRAHGDGGTLGTGDGPAGCQQ